MARFTYIAEKNGGEQYKGAAEARDRFELYRMVRAEGAHIVSVEEERGGGIFDLSRLNALFSTVSEYEKVLFARNLGAMLSAGLPLARALSVLERQTRNPRMSAVVAQVGSDVRHGELLHAALGKYPGVFSRLMVAMVRVGEEGGTLSASLAAVGEQMERTFLLKKKVRSALIYPAIVVAAMVGIGVLVMTNVVPTLAQTFREMNVELPTSTKLIIATSDFLMQYTSLAFALVLGLVLLGYAGLRTGAGRRAFDLTLVHAPIVGPLTREVNAARTARTLSSLLSSGIDVLTALDIAHDVVQNEYFRDVLNAAARSVRAGEPLSASFAKREDLYPPLVGEMMAVGEETGQMKEMLGRLAGFYEDEVDRKTKDMSTIVEPLLMVVIGAAVGFFAVSMITPIYSLSQSIS